jgi:hypothetical protein
MSIIDFEPPVKDNPYKETVGLLIEAGEGKASEIIVPKDDANKHRNLFAKAANERNKTARLRIEELVIPEDGSEPTHTRLVFTLTKRHAPRRGKEETKK